MTSAPDSRHSRTSPSSVRGSSRSTSRSCVRSTTPRATTRCSRRSSRSGQKLDMTMLAEGIETEPQFSRLRRLGCELGQGFLFSPAVPNNQVEAMVSRGFRPPRHAESRRTAPRRRFRLRPCWSTVVCPFAVNTRAPTLARSSSPATTAPGRPRRGTTLC